jgi:hypothetical protein
LVLLAFRTDALLEVGQTGLEVVVDGGQLERVGREAGGGGGRLPPLDFVVPALQHLLTLQALREGPLDLSGKLLVLLVQSHDPPLPLPDRLLQLLYAVQVFLLVYLLVRSRGLSLLLGVSPRGVLVVLFLALAFCRSWRGDFLYFQLISDHTLLL